MTPNEDNVSLYCRCPKCRHYRNTPNKEDKNDMSMIKESAQKLYDARQQKKEAEQKINEAESELDKFMPRVGSKEVFDLPNGNHLLIERVSMHPRETNFKVEVL